MEVKKNSPSNIETGWRQKFFYKIEQDSMLDNFIRLFVKQGNDWKMKKEVFDKAVAEAGLSQYPPFEYVYQEVFEIDGEYISFKDYVIQELLDHNWQWSVRNTLKNELKILRISI